MRSCRASRGGNSGKAGVPTRFRRSGGGPRFHAELRTHPGGRSAAESPCAVGLDPESEHAYKPVAFGGTEAVRATVAREAFAPTLRAS